MESENVIGKKQKGVVSGIELGRSRRNSISSSISSYHFPAFGWRFGY